MVPMRDGVRLATDIYLPSGATDPLPTLLERTPYDKRGTNHADRSRSDPKPRAKPEIAAAFADARVAVADEMRFAATAGFLEGFRTP